MKRLLVLLMLLPALTVRGEVVDRIAAVVNKDIITTYKIDQELNARLKGSDWRQLPADQLHARRSEILSSLIEEALVRQRVSELGLQVTDEEIEGAIQDVLRQNKLSRDHLVEAVESQGMKFSEYRETLRKQILRFKLLGREVQSKIEVTNQEFRDYFRENIDLFREPSTVRLSRLSFPLPKNASPEKVESVRNLAEEARERIGGGEDFHSVLVAYSADKTAEGGDMGTFSPGELSSFFTDAVAGLQEGDVTPLLEGMGGFHILKVEEKNPGRIRQFDSVREEIEQAIRARKTEEGFKVWAEGLRKNAYIDVRL